ncbi:MAG: hypothetical protein AAGA48_39835 [Myxococcota bacterium]
MAGDPAFLRRGPIQVASVTLLSVLDAASRVDGPVRLYLSRSGVDEPGLINRRDEAQDALVDQLVGSLLEEVPRASNQPRRVVLTEAGIRFLVRHRPPAERAALVESASPLYQDRLLRTWKSVASPNEASLLQACAAKLYGDLLEASRGSEGAFEMTKAKELVLSWNRADDASVRAGLARAMIALGLRPIGEVGETVAFSGRLHVSDESLFSGDPAEVMAPGWVVADASGDRILQKAKVKFCG